jgi:hypothetical protein
MYFYRKSRYTLLAMFLFEAAQASCTMLLPYAYQRHQPEKALLYQLVSSYYPAFTEYLAREGKVLPDYVQREFEAYLKCGRLEHGFLRVRCENCHEKCRWHSVANGVASPELWSTSHGRERGPAGR